MTAEPARVISVMRLTDPHQLTEPVTQIHGHPGLWFIDLPPGLSASGNAPRLTRQER